jgi:hypothetical protein
MRQVFLNPQMRQIDAEGERASNLHRSWSGDASDSVEALVPRACGETGGWHNRLYNGNRLRDSITGIRSSICVHLFHLRIAEAKLR